MIDCTATGLCPSTSTRVSCYEVQRIEMKRGSKRNRLIDYYAGVPLLAVAAVLRHRREWPQDIKRVGILATPALGDTLLCSGPIQDIRSLFPRQELSFFAARSNLLAAQLLPGVDRVETISISNPLTAIRLLRSCHLDLLVDFTSWQRVTALISALSGARFVAGYRTPGQHRHLGYDRTIEHRRDRHEIDNLRALAQSVGATSTADPRIVLPLGEPPEALSRASEVIVFHAWPSGARSWLRKWPEDRWVELAKALSRPGRLFVITGSPQDLPHSKAFCERLLREGLSAEVFVGEGGLAPVARLLQGSRLLVSVNTGIMHLGAILGTPTISINGPTAQHRWGPVGRCVAGVNPPDGSGGFLHFGYEFDGNPDDTMQRISAAQVIDAAQEVLLQSVSVIRDGSVRTF
jgi:heptosyltransferase-3